MSVSVLTLHSVSRRQHITQLHDRFLLFLIMTQNMGSQIHCTLFDQLRIRECLVMVHEMCSDAAVGSMHRV